MATETNLGTVHVFNSLESFKQNSSNVGASDLSLVPMAGEIVAQSLGENGYIKFNNGLIIQWGRSSTTAKNKTDYQVTFPVAFSSACYSITSAYHGSDNGSTANYDQGYYNLTLTGFKWQHMYAGNTEWMAIGR